MLVLARNFHEAQRRQERAEWNRFAVIAYASGVRELHGSKLAILGAGPIGANLARMAAALGMRVRVLRRDARRAVAGAEAVCGPERLHELLGWADFVVLAVPLTAETRHLIGAAELRCDALGCVPHQHRARRGGRRGGAGALPARRRPGRRGARRLRARSRCRRSIRSGRCRTW